MFMSPTELGGLKAKGSVMQQYAALLPTNVRRGKKKRRRGRPISHGMAMEERGRAAREWLESIIAKRQTEEAGGEAVWKGGFFEALSLSGLRISRAEAGRALCSFRVAAHLTDREGNWQAGAIATLMDDVGAAAIMTMEGLVKVSVQFDISYFSPARANEEVEIDARIVQHKEGRRLTAVVVEIRKKGSAQLVAVGRQWMTSGRPFRSNI